LSGTLQHVKAVYSVAIMGDGTLLASASADGLRLWNLATQKVETLAQGDEVDRVAFSPDGRLLASGGRDGRILLWDVLTRKRVDPPLVMGDAISSMVFSHDGRTIASGGPKEAVDVWDLATRKLTHHGLKSPGVYGIAFSPDDKELATVSMDR